jgi:carbamoyl-phosphate synthase small subunit
VSTEAYLALADGQVFPGVSCGLPGIAMGEVVFQTAMTGYQEVLTDPSYTGQIVTFTMPHIGNVGCNPDDEQSSQVCASGLVVRELSTVTTGPRATGSLCDYLERHGVVGISGVNTRALTHYIRTHGAQPGAIGPCAETALAAARRCPSLQGLDLAREVTTPVPYSYLPIPFAGSAPSGRLAVVVDYGTKRGILSCLASCGWMVVVVPAMASTAEVLAWQPDAVVLSNGPGDPAACTYAHQVTRELLDAGVPILGVCLGHQILALACGARTIKMAFGHHGINHPVTTVATANVAISSQNHGFVVDEATLPDELVVTHRSLFDGTVQGVAHRHVLAWGFQGHPEADPGPDDLQGLFAAFLQAALADGVVV